MRLLSFLTLHAPVRGSGETPCGKKKPWVEAEKVESQSVYLIY
jgi:hypothetical protein